MQLFKVCFCHELVRELVKKRMELALTQITADVNEYKSANNIPLQSFLCFIL